MNIEEGVSGHNMSVWGIVLIEDREARFPVNISPLRPLAERHEEMQGGQREGSGIDQSARLPLPQLRPEHPRGQAWQLQGVSFVEESALWCKCPVCGLINSTNKPWQLRLGLLYASRKCSTSDVQRVFSADWFWSFQARATERGSGAMVSTRRTRGLHRMLVRGYPLRIGSTIRAARLTSTLISHHIIVLPIAYNGPDHRLPRQRAHRPFQAAS
jgi:hypothetical protein